LATEEAPVSDGQSLVAMATMLNKKEDLLCEHRVLGSFVDGFGSLTHSTGKLRIFQEFNCISLLVGMAIKNNVRLLTNLAQESIQCLDKKLSFMTRWQL
jgi:hypothetical protein